MPVAMAAGAPGMFSKIAVIAPPYTAPTKTPHIRAGALCSSQEKVKVISSDTAIVPESPGMTPTHMPAAAPAQRRAVISQLVKGIKRYCTMSIRLS